MNGFMVFLALAFVVAIFVVVAAAAKQGGKSKFSVTSKPLLTDNERSFFRVLVGALPAYLVFPQVSFGAFLAVDPKLSLKARPGIRNRFSQKIADFVVCEPETLRIVALVELDDKTHSAGADLKRDELTQAAGYRTLRFQSKQKPTAATIVALFAQLASPGSAPAVEPVPRPKQRVRG